VDLQIRETGPESLPQYTGIPIRFTVESVFEVDPVDGGLHGLALTEKGVSPYVKDYDILDNGENSPLSWPKRFDMKEWGVFLAFENDRAVAGAVAAVPTIGLDLLEGHEDTAALWDIRVRPEDRGRGIGSVVLRHGADWCRSKGFRKLKIETQNINVPACRFYARHGAVLGAIDKYGYAGCRKVEHEVVLIWYLEL